MSRYFFHVRDDDYEDKVGHYFPDPEEAKAQRPSLLRNLLRTRAGKDLQWSSLMRMEPRLHVCRYTNENIMSVFMAVRIFMEVRMVSYFVHVRHDFALLGHFSKLENAKSHAIAIAKALAQDDDWHRYSAVVIDERGTEIARVPIQPSRAQHTRPDGPIN
jgi:hypothetical protein